MKIPRHHIVPKRSAKVATLTKEMIHQLTLRNWLRNTSEADRTAIKAPKRVTEEISDRKLLLYICLRDGILLRGIIQGIT